ncbi:MAG: hypothetical protein COU90_00930 [Candidatus Ryanbacteria bacterium CG10_big_fil_rev_8_21_14_0_10_43_42]|uniref:Uncharacterized protein n=1 Tax=Candidatus Ryanbacteria bacterium CG10_big_fil_rev_8_21_14_0_10_43_42 TaxID=1974864 RepID=A0A2M8KY40_9BACT|nr:MAG: hypothetical protein COU90_00930 [Candidatus Ryanbacteria bacterium CG10_big_fil_rev_8_21_14_0_10_43_42]
MFTKLGQFLDKTDDTWHVKRPPMRYTNERGEDFVIMAARHYEELTGEDSNRLQAYEVFDSMNLTDADDSTENFKAEMHQISKEGESEPVQKADDVFSVVSPGILGAGLASIPLEDEIHLEDLPL